MKFTFRTRFIAAASMTLAAGLIGCQIHRSHTSHQPSVRSELIHTAEPLPLDGNALPRSNNQTPILVPQTQLPPADDEDPVPSAGLSPIQRMCFSSCSSCNTGCSSCTTSCSPCSPGLFDHMRQKMARSQCKMNSVRSRFHDLLAELNPLSGSCSSCSPCGSPCGSSCETVMDGFVIDDGCSSNMWMPGSGCSPCASNSGMWMPASYPNMAYQQPMSPQYPPMNPGQPPCNCRGEQHFQQPTYAPQYPQAQQPYYPPQPQAQYNPQPHPQYGSQPQPQYNPQPQYSQQPQYAHPQPSGPQYQPTYPTPVLPQRDVLPNQNFAPSTPVPMAPGTN